MMNNNTESTNMELLLILATMAAVFAALYGGWQ